MRSPTIRLSSLYNQRPPQTEAWRRHVHGNLATPKNYAPAFRLYAVSAALVLGALAWGWL